MSRAFVKEDAQPEPILRRRPTTEGGGFPLTLSGANRFRRELQQLRSAQAPVSPESAERIAWLEEVLSKSEILDVRTLAGPQVKLGATVVLRDVDGEPNATYQIVGELEADLKLGRINVTSPLGRALIGREVGDLVQVHAPRGGREYEILEIRWVEAEGPP
jgi:hypothetical protein